MAVVHRPIYTLMYDGVSFGITESLGGLQGLYDIVTDSVVEGIRKKGVGAPVPDMNVSIDTRCVDVNGVYIRSCGAHKIDLSALRNKQRDFFQYLSAYKRDLYTDRERDGEVAEALLAAIETRRTLQERLMYLQKEWFEQQLEKGGGGVYIQKYPVWDDIERQLSVVNDSIASALQKMSA